jgi:hypothetical protein
LEGSGHSLTEALSRILPGGTEEERDTSVRIGSDPASSPTDHLWSLSLVTAQSPTDHLWSMSLVTGSQTYFISLVTLHADINVASIFRVGVLVCCVIFVGFKKINHA